MLAASLTTVFFSLSVIFASRSARIIGGPRANVARGTLALCFLAIWAHVYGKGVAGPSFPWFLFSGVVGFGFGDISLFYALPRIGPRLSILLTQCLAAPIAALAEWAWIGTRLHPSEIACGGLILVGVAFALAPDQGWEVQRRDFWIGVLWGVGSALGQAFGAVISRKANLVAELGGFSLDGGTAAYQRLIGGVAMIWLIFALTRGWRSQPGVAADSPAWRRAAPSILGNALSGPVMGVGCFQWALQTTASGIVLPIVATSPLVTMILAFFIERLRPNRRAIVGGILAVAGAVLLKWVQGLS